MRAAGIHDHLEFDNHSGNYDLHGNVEEELMCWQLVWRLETVARVQYGMHVKRYGVDVKSVYTGLRWFPPPFEFDPG